VFDGLCSTKFNFTIFQYSSCSSAVTSSFVGVSSGASLAAVAQLLPQVADGARILTFAYDTGERYLSVEALWG